MSPASSCIPIDQQELDLAIQDASNWAVLWDTLYELCRRYPDHTDPVGSNAKLWLIGRALATGVERQIKSKGGQGSAMQTLCSFVNHNHLQVDEIINQIREVQEPLDEGKLETIVREHGRLCRLLSPILNGTSPRSFVSKYLHCHCTAVPIYDNVAKKKLGTVCRWKNRFKVFDQPEEADMDYYRFTLRFLLCFYMPARQLRQDVTVRLLDQYLLW